MSAMENSSLMPDQDGRDGESRLDLPIEGGNEEHAAAGGRSRQLDLPLAVTTTHQDYQQAPGIIFSPGG